MRANGRTVGSDTQNIIQRITSQQCLCGLRRENSSCKLRMYKCRLTVLRNFPNVKRWLSCLGNGPETDGWRYTYTMEMQVGSTLSRVEPTTIAADGKKAVTRLWHHECAKHTWHKTNKNSILELIDFNNTVKSHVWKSANPSSRLRVDIWPNFKFKCKNDWLRCVLLALAHNLPGAICQSV